jgi:hypothetical protein
LGVVFVVVDVASKKSNEKLEDVDLLLELN